MQELKRIQQLAGILKEGFQGDSEEGDGMSGFRGSSSTSPLKSMSPIQQRNINKSME